MHQRVTKDNLTGVLVRFNAWTLTQDHETRELIAKDVDDFLETLAEHDAFGPKRQADPRATLKQRFDGMVEESHARK